MRAPAGLQEQAVELRRAGSTAPEIAARPGWASPGPRPVTVPRARDVYWRMEGVLSGLANGLERA